MPRNAQETAINPRPLSVADAARLLAKVGGGPKTSSDEISALAEAVWASRIGELNAN